MVDTHGKYRYTARNVATKLKVKFIDANSITEKLESGLGEEGSKKLHLIYNKGEEAAYPEGITDNTHYNVYGGKTVSKLLEDALTADVSPLAQYRK